MQFHYEWEWIGPQPVGEAVSAFRVGLKVRASTVQKYSILFIYKITQWILHGEL